MNRRFVALLVGVSGFAGGCAHGTDAADGPAPARVEAPSGQTTFDDCELGDGSSVPSAFPRGALAPPSAAEHTLACSLSTQLEALGEPSLFPLPQTAEVYRVLWIRSGGHPVSVRFERQGTTGQIRGAQTSAKGDAAPGDLQEESSSVASAEVTRDVLARVEAARFWASPTPPAAVPAPPSVSTWIVEGAHAGQYRVRVFHRETLATDPAYGGLARALVGASGLHIQGGVY